MDMLSKKITGEQLRESVQNILDGITQPGANIPWAEIGQHVCDSYIMPGCGVAFGNLLEQIIQGSSISISIMKGGIWDYFWDGLAYALNNLTCDAVDSGLLMYFLVYSLSFTTKEKETTNTNNGSSFHYQELFDQGYWGAQYARYKTCEATALAPPRRDPLVLDLDKDGDISPSRRAYFDYDGDGVRELGSWFSPDDGLLAIDKNGDGAINDGSELFGDAFVKENGAKASNGMDALRDIDGNDDGVIDASDEKFSQLRIWKDTNGDGVSQAEEIHTLEELGVMSLGTSSEAVNQTDALGNTQINAGTFTFSDGTAGAMGDWSLQTNHMATKYDYTLTEEQKAAIEGLPCLASVGGLRPLDYAMANNETLTAHIRELCDPATGASRQYELMDQILYEWAGVSHIEAGSRGGLVDARQLAVMEKIFKDHFLQAGTSANPTSTAAPGLNRPHKAYDNTIYAA